METKRFNEAVKRNTEKFPPDLMFQLTADEFANLRSQIATSSLDSPSHGGRRYLPRVFTQHDSFSHTTRTQLKQVFDALRQLMVPPDPPKRPIGFVTPQDKST